MVNNISDLYDKTYYINKDIKYIFSNYIREYDISKANINILYCDGLIDDNLYNKLYKASRMERQITIGNLQRQDKRYIESIQNGIKKSKEILFNMNNIQDKDILTIKNDAIFTINKKLDYTKINDFIEFKEKNIFNNYILLDKIEIYFSIDKINEDILFDIKGLGELAQSLHLNYMTMFILDILYYLSIGQLQLAHDEFKSFFEMYSFKKLDKEYYREYNPDSNFSIINSSYKVSGIEEKDLINVNISYNLKILRELYSIITDLIFLKNK